MLASSTRWCGENTDSMRCLILTNHFLPESFRCNDVAFDLAHRGYAVTVLTAIPDYPEGHYHKGYSLFKRRLEVIDGVKIIRVPVLPRGNGGALRLVLNYVSGLVSFFFYALYQALFHKYDCIFVHDTSPAFIALPAVLIKKIRKTPIDLWILDMWPQSLTAGGINSPMVFSLVDRMMDHIYRNCSVIHISSYGFRKLLAERGVSDDKIKYLPNWSDDSIVLSSETAIPELPNGFRIMFAGNMGEAQNLENVLAAAALLKEHRNIHWIFLGDGRKKAWVEEFVSRNGFLPQCICLVVFRLPQCRPFSKRRTSCWCHCKISSCLSLHFRRKFRHICLAPSLFLQCWMEKDRRLFFPRTVAGAFPLTM